MATFACRPLSDRVWDVAELSAAAYPIWRSVLLCQARNRQGADSSTFVEMKQKERLARVIRIASTQTDYYRETFNEEFHERPSVRNFCSRRFGTEFRSLRAGRRSKSREDVFNPSIEIGYCFDRRFLRSRTQVLSRQISQSD